MVDITVYGDLSSQPQCVKDYFAKADKTSVPMSERYFLWLQFVKNSVQDVEWTEDFKSQKYLAHINARTAKDLFATLSYFGLSNKVKSRFIKYDSNNVIRTELGHFGKYTDGKSKAEKQMRWTENLCLMQIDIFDVETGKLVSSQQEVGEEAQISEGKSCMSDGYKRVGPNFGIGTKCYKYPKVSINGYPKTADKNAAFKRIEAMLNEGLVSAKTEVVFNYDARTNNLRIVADDEIVWESNPSKPAPQMPTKEVGTLVWNIANAEAYENYQKVVGAINAAIAQPEGSPTAVLTTFAAKEDQVKVVLSRLTTKALFMHNGGYYYFGSPSEKVKQANPDADIKYHIYQIAETQVETFVSMHKDAKLIILS